MLRTSRILASLLQSLVLGSAFATVTVGAATALVGCANENQPEYWIDKLDDKAWRPRAIDRLSQFFEDSMTKANKDFSNPEVKGLLDKLVGPLTNIYVTEYDNLDEKTRESLINLLAGFKDQRAEPALKAAFEEFGKRGRGGKEVKWAARAVRDMKLKGTAPAVFEAFKKTKPSTKEGAYYRDLNEALLAVSDPSWATELIPMLEEDMPVMKPNDANSVNDYKDRLYQTVTAAQVLGELGNANAVKPLIKVVLDPAKKDAGNEALLALTKIGKPSVDAAIKLFQNKDDELAQFHQKKLQKASGADKPPGGTPHVDVAGMILGAIGRGEAVAPVLEALNAAKEDSDKVTLLTTLAMLPRTAQVKTAFIEGMKGIDADTEVDGANAMQTLSEPATLFFDASVADLLVQRAGELKGKDDKEKLTKALLLLAALKVMDQSNVAAVGAAISALPKDDGALGPTIEKIKSSYDLAKKLIDTCKKDAGCYLKEAQKPENQTDKTQLVAMKALYSYGQLTGPDGAGALIDALPGLPDGALRYVVSQIIDTKFPQGNEEIAKKLDAIVAKNRDSMDTDKASNDKPLRDAVYRLRARQS
ncbi:MAG TPA: hypothetical protein VHM70_23140 [Polyangiaceae bacterium]|jgi:hypothetical protein|nr:hypothetical protein [Polyangiaceae bacterium]